MAKLPRNDKGMDHLLDITQAAGRAGAQAVAPFSTSGPEPRVTRKRTARRVKRDWGREALKFRTTHPHTYDLFLRFARELAAHPSRYVGVGLVYERVRWELIVTKQPGGDGLNNNYRAHFARWALNDAPELRGLMKVRDSLGRRLE